LGIVALILEKILTKLNAGLTVTQSGDIDFSPFETILSSKVDLTTGDTAYKLPSSEQSARKLLAIYNNTGHDIYIGGSSVTTSNGYLVADGKQLGIGASKNVYAVCGTSSVDLRVLECK